MGRKKTKVIYLIGSLKNRKKIIDLANRLRKLGFEVFDDWIAPGPDADDYWERL
jgi:cell division septation protein DedD